MLKERDKSDNINVDQIRSFIENRVKKLNDQITATGDEGGAQFGLSTAYQIGPAYFKEYNYDDDSKSREDIWERRIEPILREYVRGRSSEKIEKFIRKCREVFVGSAKETETNVKSPTGNDKQADGDVSDKA